MSIPSAILMNMLSSGVRAISGAAPAGEASVGASDFSAMLGRARSGELETGLPVTIGRGSGIDLSDDQLSRLARAADRAESAGARRALVLIDGRALELDVATRQVIREHSMADARVVTGIDGVIDLGGSAGTPGAEGAESVGLIDGTPGARPWNRSLMEALAQRETDGRGAQD